MVERQHLVNQINNATAIVYNQLGRLKMMDKKFSTMEDYYIQQITTNMKAGNNMRAKIMANELANLRRVRRNTQHTGMALEALVIRFSTINEFAMILDAIDPTVQMIKEIQADLSRAMPTANDALQEVSFVTADVLAASNVRGESAKIVTPLDADTLNILSEIEGALENEAKAKLPEVPAGLPEAQQEQQVLVEG
jgi:division protein CdvB (Snf7/Vps24/ESCRT-III family)